MLYHRFSCCLLLAFGSRVAQSLSLSQHSTPANVPDLANNTTWLEYPEQVANLTGQYGCIPSSKFQPWTKRPSLRDCGGAIRRLPSSPDIGTFGPKSLFPFCIPTDATVGSCKVTVGFSGAIQSVRSSWTEIGLSAVELALGCIKKEYTGGSTTTGPQDLIKVELVFVKGSDPDYAATDS